MDIISKFTGHLKSVLTRALTLVIEKQGETIEPEHLLWALGTQSGSVAAEILVKAGVQTQDLHDFVGSERPPAHAKMGRLVPILSDASKTIIEKAVLTANLHEHRYVGTEHLLSGLLQSRSEEVEQFFEDTRTDLGAMNSNLTTVFHTTSRFPHLSEMNSPQKDLSSVLLSEGDETSDDSSKTPALDYFTEELTDTSLVAELDPVIGRQSEIDRLIKIISRRTKNNPVLVGEPGVGKTAIIEGLAKRIVEGEVPDTLADKRIFQLDLTSLIAGTMYRGEFESRLKQLVEEVTERPDVILFIDEVHSIMGAGAATGSLDAANMLKPALARGSIRCIGATTPSEFKKFIEADGALERRFQPIYVNEPTAEETLSILTGVKDHYETYHGVTFTEPAIKTAVELAQRYIHNKQFPDKAIDVLDEAGAHANVHRKKKKRAHPASLAQQLEQIKTEKRNAVEAEQFAKAMELKEQQLALETEMSAAKEKRVEKITITESDIVRIVAEMTGIPAAHLTASAQKHLPRLAANLKQHIIGQDAVVERVARALQRAQLGLAHAERPLGSFLFIGPSGVGKTALARAMAKQVFHNKDAFLRLDMSEFSERFTMSKLIGAPAGYVGYRDTNKLADHVKQHPYSVILLDELEKAHPDVLNILLQILDHGKLTDATGKTITFKQCLIVMTSNIGSERFEKGGLGFAENEKNVAAAREADIRQKAREHFSRELVNRIQHVCVFSPLTKASLIKIAKKELNELQDRLSQTDISLQFTPSIASQLAKNVNAKFGARDLSRVIEEHIEHPLAEALLHLKRGQKKHFAIKRTKDGTLSILHKKN